jgi:hypothetical protein
MHPALIGRDDLVAVLCERVEDEPRHARRVDDDRVAQVLGAGAE